MVFTATYNNSLSYFVCWASANRADTWVVKHFWKYAWYEIYRMIWFYYFMIISMQISKCNVCTCHIPIHSINLSIVNHKHIKLVKGEQRSKYANPRVCFLSTSLIFCYSGLFILIFDKSAKNPLLNKEINTTCVVR